ncbi:probable disease resistance protein At1g52660 [Lotus japonicus]|uniref:probable disease resistance protein At1g52660 n=1 Tax=Lotus japonicus TaxID=34305 RepID=UPI00258D118E|nr:probable disease resistance protein At1g52660 [Lotus japonicus]
MEDHHILRRNLQEEILTYKYINGYPMFQIMEYFKSEKEKLISNLDHVQKKVEATRKTTKLNDAISEWLNDAVKLTEEVENQEIEIESEMGTPTPDEYSFTHIIGTIYELHCDIIKKMKKLNAKCEFESFSSPIPGLVYFSSGNFMCFKSTEKASNEILEALQDDSNLIVGLYGRKGSGKTTLVKTLAEKAKYLKIFNVVIFVIVPPNPNIKRIQDQIADSLNLKLDKGTEFERARQIYLTLSNMDRMLVILDDVRTKLELEDIGIPCDNSEGNKILLTTRRKTQCNLIGCQRKIHLGSISKREAWKLFKKHSSIDNETPSNISKVGHEVAVECQGLPGRIKDVGTSLKSEPIEHWNELLNSLRHSMARYQIYISFRGEDTGCSFAGYLYRALCREGFKTFMDDGRLEGGDEISPSLVKMIEASRLSIVVFSQNYAKSCLCLDELATILKFKETKNQVVWPIFYKVEPTDIRHQKNNYEKALAEHDEKFANDPEKVQRWRSTLSKIVDMSGFSYTAGYEYKFIQDMVERANNIKKYDLYLQSWDMD